MRRLYLVVLVAVVAWPGCKSEKQETRKRLKRQGDAPPVVMIDREVTGASRLTDEVEPNNDVKAAGPMVVGEGVRGTMATEADVDVFSFVADKDSILAVTLSGGKNADLMLTVVAGKDTFESDRGPAEIVEGLPNLPVRKGDVVTLTVKEFISKKRQRLRKRGKEKPRLEPSGEYELSVVLVVPRQTDELEPNHDSTQARELLLGDQGHGYIGWANDVDTWRCSLTGFSASYSLDLDVSGIAGVPLKLEVLDSEGTVVVTSTAKADQDVFVRNLIPQARQSSYVVRLTSGRSNPQSNYVIRTSSRMVGDQEEREPNDDVSTGTLLRDGSAQTAGTMQGFLLGGDVDVYLLSATTVPAVLSVTVAPPAGVNPAVEIKVGGKSLAESDLGRDGVAEKLVAVPVPVGRNVLVVVKGEFSGDSPAPYQLTWSLEEARTSFEDEGANDGPGDDDVEGP